MPTPRFSVLATALELGSGKSASTPNIVSILLNLVGGCSLGENPHMELLGTQSSNAISVDIW